MRQFNLRTLLALVATIALVLSLYPWLFPFREGDRVTMKEGTFEGFELWVNKCDFGNRTVTATSPVGRASDVVLKYSLIERIPD